MNINILLNTFLEIPRGYIYVFKLGMILEQGQGDVQHGTKVVNYLTLLVGCVVSRRSSIGSSLCGTLESCALPSTVRTNVDFTRVITTSEELIVVVGQTPNRHDNVNLKFSVQLQIPSANFQLEGRDTAGCLLSDSMWR